MQQAGFSTASWDGHEMHPEARDETTVAFIFTMDLLNFSFWSPLPDDERFAVEYRGRRWTGYGSLVAALQRALEEGGFFLVLPASSSNVILAFSPGQPVSDVPIEIPITDPHYWQNEEECTLDALRYVFRSCTDEEMPLLEERLACLREAGQVLYEVR